MTHDTVQRSPLTIGLDVGDSYIHYCILGPEDDVVARGKFKTTRGELRSALKRWRSALVVLEAGSQSPWMSRALSPMATKSTSPTRAASSCSRRTRASRIGVTTRCSPVSGGSDQS